MNTTPLLPDYIFELSWEVCNMVGGIYTVLSTRAKTMQMHFHDKVFFIGPDNNPKGVNPLFEEDESLLAKWRKDAAQEGIFFRAGRWNVPGKPIVLLVEYKHYYSRINEIYAQMWEMAKLDSLHGYGDYDTSSLFAYSAGVLTEFIVKRYMMPTDKIVFQAHEWMSAMGMLYLQGTTPQVGTIFTTHATSVGRSITSNNKMLYKYFEHYDGDQMAAELHVESKQSSEKQPALLGDCLTTVSDITAKECLQFFGKEIDVVLENGFEDDFVPKATEFTKKRKAARTKILNVAKQLMGENFTDDTLIVSTSGRNDYRSKGFDILFEALAQLDRQGTDRKVLVLVEVPCWVETPREDLITRLAEGKKHDTPLALPYITHWLHNFSEDRIVNTMKTMGLTNEGQSNLHVMLVPCYLDGKDGVFNSSYYDLLIGNDLCIYPSYYEPWGYTPLESIAFRIPCITTDLSGFGQWVNKVLEKETKIEDGVHVVHRDDDNYMQVAETIKDTIVVFSQKSSTEVTAIRRKAANLASKALWQNFFAKYLTAYDIALRKAETRIKQS